jgi:hypothetical protein
MIYRYLDSGDGEVLIFLYIEFLAIAAMHS